MNGPAMLGNGTVVTAFSASRGEEIYVIPNGAVVWEGKRIVAAGPEAELRRAYPHARFLDAQGGMILPGLVNLHHHFYSALALGLDPGAPMDSFTEILDRLWWRLDRALEPEDVRVSAEVSAAECIRWGCTTVFDHHASPSCLEGSLDILADVLDGCGLSGVLCYEVSDRNGHAEARAGIEENLRFIRQHSKHPRIRGVFGLHASFTLHDETLAEVAERRPTGAGCHIHAGEDAVDVEASRRAFGRGPMDRLERFGLLDERCLLAHGVQLDASDLAKIARSKAVVIHNPESNANNRVGRFDAVRARGLGCRVGLGTDGMSASMLRALRLAMLSHRAGGGESAPECEFLEMLAENARVAGVFLDEPLLGRLAPGAPADVIAVDALPRTPIEPYNLVGHLAYGASEAPVRHAVARGRVLLEDFRHKTMDPAEIARRARDAAPALWERFHALRGGTRFLGD